MQPNVLRPVGVLGSNLKERALAKASSLIGFLPLHEVPSKRRFDTLLPGAVDEATKRQAGTAKIVGFDSQPKRIKISRNPKQNESLEFLESPKIIRDQLSRIKNLVAKAAYPILAVDLLLWGIRFSRRLLEISA